MLSGGLLTTDNILTNLDHAAATNIFSTVNMISSGPSLEHFKIILSLSYHHYCVHSAPTCYVRYVTAGGLIGGIMGKTPGWEALGRMKEIINWIGVEILCEVWSLDHLRFHISSLSIYLIPRRNVVWKIFVSPSWCWLCPRTRPDSADKKVGEIWRVL